MVFQTIWAPLACFGAFYCTKIAATKGRWPWLPVGLEQLDCRDSTLEGLFPPGFPREHIYFLSWGNREAVEYNTVKQEP